jgi:hypothetical protein
MNWFKMFTEARNDAKLRSLTDAQHRTWFRLLCYAAEQAERGKVGPTPLPIVALEVADGSASLLEETCNALQALQCVTWSKCDSGAVEIEFLSFDKRQGPKPSDDPGRVRDRVARHRANTRPAKQLAPNDRPTLIPVTPPGNACNALHETCNAPVTPLEEIREEKKKTPLPPETGGSAGPSDDPEILRIANLAADLAGDVSWSCFVCDMAKMGHPAHAIEQAIQVGVSKGRWNRALLMGVLRRMASEGYPRAKSGGGRPAPAAPPIHKPFPRATPEDEEWTRIREEKLREKMREKAAARREIA